MLTPTEAAAQQMLGASKKCSHCVHGSNITWKGIHTCKHGFSPKHCTIYKLEPEIAIRLAQQAFEGD